MNFLIEHCREKSLKKKIWIEIFSWLSIQIECVEIRSKEVPRSETEFVIEAKNKQETLNIQTTSSNKKNNKKSFFW